MNANYDLEEFGLLGPDRPEIYETHEMELEDIQIPHSPIPSETTSSSSAESRAPEAHLEHFKVLYDQTWDYEKIAKRFFLPEPYQCLVMREHANLPNTHVHFQGYTNIAHGSFQSKLKRLAALHHSRKINPKSRPTSMCTRAPDVKGFQYMSKELKAPLYSHGFTEDQLAELKDLSQGHVKAMKTKVFDLIVAMDPSILNYKGRYDDAKALIAAIIKHLRPQFEDGQITFSKYLKQDIIKGLIARKDLPTTGALFSNLLLLQV